MIATAAGPGRSGLFRALIAACCLCVECAQADAGATLLRQTYARLAPQLADNAFHRPLHIESTESSSAISGEVYALLDHPFGTLSDEFARPQRSPGNWCDLLILHLNVTYCRPGTRDGHDMLTIDMGNKKGTLPPAFYRASFDYRTVADEPGYFQVVLSAATGPMSTRDYRIGLEAVALDGGHTFVHLDYTTGFGMAGRLAMQVYLSTVGAAKVGFTPSSPPDPRHPFVGGPRGIAERNAMRTYLALQVYLATLPVPAERRMAERFARWFDATEAYPR